MKILFTGGGGAANEAVFRLLGDRFELHFADADREMIDPSIPADRCHEIPWASDAAFLERVAWLCRKLGIGLLVPSVDEELLPLARAAESLAPTRLMLPAAGYIETMSDKLTSLEALAAKGVRVPRSQPMGRPVDDVVFPCIVKPRHGRGSRGVRTVPDRAALEELRMQLGAGAETMVVQEKLTGTEYTVQMVADASARLQAVVPVRVALKRGITLRAQTDDEPAVIAACQAIHEAVPAAGCYNIQLMLTPGGVSVPFEINPRVSTTFCLTVAAGVDPISVFLGAAGSASPLPFAVGVTLRRHWMNHLSMTAST